MAHITAGDLAPLVYRAETSPGVPTGDPAYYADAAEGGSITWQDNPTPYKAWRYGSRGYSVPDYVQTQKDLGLTANLETRDVTGWERIITNALGSTDTSANPYGVLPTREVRSYVRTGASAWQGRIWTGVKTDTLAIHADTPAGIVKFDETVLAGSMAESDITAALPAWSASDAPAVQWLGATLIGSTEVYPQSFSVSIANALDRVRTADGAKALREGRREISVELNLWMEDLSFVRRSYALDGIGNVTIGMGDTAPIALVLKGVRPEPMSPALAQDKQRQTVRLIASDAAVVVG